MWTVLLNIILCLLRCDSGRGVSLKRPSMVLNKKSDESLEVYDTYRATMNWAIINHVKDILEEVSINLDSGKMRDEKNSKSQLFRNLGRNSLESPDKEGTAKLSLKLHHTECGVTYRENSGKINFPQHRGKYDNNVNCSWIIETSRSSIQFTFQFFRTELYYDQLLIQLSSLVKGKYDGICGIHKNSVPDIITRIVGGAPAEEHEFPWQVSLQWRYHFFTYHICGAAVINKQWIITAAHCTHRFTPTDLLIVAGDHHLKAKEGEEQTRSIEQIVEHEDYNANTQENDIALIKLSDPLSINGMSVSPVCLPPSGWEYSGDCVVTGWGKLSEGGRSADELQKVIVPIISNEECVQSYRNIGYTGPIADTMICAGYKLGGKDACQGDSGSPFVCRGSDNRYFLAGIVSWGFGCARANIPGVYTKVSQYIDWINNMVNNRLDLPQGPANLCHGSLEEPTNDDSQEDLS